ncbi:hypothetical protein QEH59_05305 [Coraliomargarita sp. SDUM461004]|uniref:site-specific DNA-methyltransferase (adenine-specific) n=1 Tax=Thalassobacterium sedimentorum TaxID=3041258 RepID=A0ABU1AGH1_9BACT|nr:DNA methyltransferase [Coraliomargarita sp. SDUM461004]MDQ8193829.1 hypothetical protein [Coraliomargarita sp. SDUM461004]
MRYSEVAANVQALAQNSHSQAEFVYEFLLAYGTPKASIARLKSGQMNLAKDDGELLLKKKLYFAPATDDLFEALETLKAVKGTLSHDPRFLFVTDFEHVVAFDRKTADSLHCALADLGSHFDFFLPLAGMEKQKLSNESVADRNAAERMAKLFDAIKAHNPEFIERNPHAMNVFLARLLFCFFAEDTGIFDENAVSNSIASHTAPDASDLHDFFVKLFDLLDRKSRDGLPKHLQDFPYVNGGLFRDHFPIPEFSIKARRMMIEAGKLNWSDINPDIFGSMFQAVIDPEERHNLGQHYTSVTNIMKVIEPLFLNDFRAAFEKATALKRGKAPALHRLLDRIAKVKIFDPACGSGNFLIIAYKELRRLEMDIFRELQKDTGELPLSGLKVSQFYGIEISDFAAETAVLALWLTEHQMNLESKKVCGQAPDNLPLKDGAKIVCANACRIDWEDVCPKEAEDEIYILGNPPYLGARVQSKSHKADMASVFGKIKGVNSLDYITCWFYKASKYIRGSHACYAFVSTNSICQGEQVAMIWPHLLGNDLEIFFAHKSFKWTNSAKGNAGVTCVVVGVASSGEKQNFLFSGVHRKEVQHINPYLVEAHNVYVESRRRLLSDIPELSFGSMANDGGGLILSDTEKNELLNEDPNNIRFVRKFLGSAEFIRGQSRSCLWLLGSSPTDFGEDSFIGKRIKLVEEHRNYSTREATRKLAEQPHLFGEIRHHDAQSIIIPKVSSERREYIPIAFLPAETIISDLAFGIYDANPTIFGLLTSRMHMTWVRAVAGRLEERLRYSAGLCYNTFPVPKLNEAHKQTLTEHVMEVLQQRENHPEKTMAQLYDPDKMPAGLRAAHQQLDLTVDRIYRKAPFSSDEERLEHLFKRYEAMIEQEKEKK